MPSNPLRLEKMVLIGWHSAVVRFAAFASMSFGLLAVVFPVPIIQRLNADPVSISAELSQCLGIVVGAVGIGLWCAAKDPVRNWPVILTGFVSHAFAPVVFLPTVFSEHFPPLIRLAILSNSLIFGILFGLILLRTLSCFRHAESANRMTQSSRQDRASASRQARSHVEITVRPSNHSLPLASKLTAQN